MRRASPDPAAPVTLPGPSHIPGSPHWALHDTLINPTFALESSEDSWKYLSPIIGNLLPMRPVWARQTAKSGKPLFAIGMLTMIGEDYLVRRHFARKTMHARHKSLLDHGIVVLRYLLPKANPMNPDNQWTAPDAIHDENTTYGDLVRLETPDGPTRCWRKVILWFRHALQTWPNVQYVGVADDDVYLVLSRLAHDLALLSAAGHKRVYWGQPMWMAYWNDTRFEGEGFTTTGAEQDRHAVEEYKDAFMRRLKRGSRPGRRLSAKRGGGGGGGSGGSSGGGLSGASCSYFSPTGDWIGNEMAMGPFLFANTDLTFLGSDLIKRILDGRCLPNFERSLSEAERTGRFRRKKQYPCEPNIDQLLGYLVRHAARNVTYVQSQFQTQGFPWMTYQHNRPSQSTFYVHKLGSDVWQWRYADSLFAKEGPYRPMPRVCKPCYVPQGKHEESWVSEKSPSRSYYSRWTCCATMPRAMLGDDSLERCTKERAHSSDTFQVGGKALPLLDGYCAPTDDTDKRQNGNRSCGMVGDKRVQGYWKWMHDLKKPHSLKDCVQRCLACPACNYVSFSESHFQRECSWYASCPRYAWRRRKPQQKRVKPDPRWQLAEEARLSGDSKLERIGSELCPTFSTVRVRPDLD